jgi:hypothetical protein
MPQVRLRRGPAAGCCRMNLSSLPVRAEGLNQGLTEPPDDPLAAAETSGRLVKANGAGAKFARSWSQLVK